MPRYRVNAAGEVEIRAHRAKTAAVLVGIVAFTAGSVWVLLLDPRAWLAWVGLALFGGGGAFFVWKQLRLGLLGGGPALVLGPEGLVDRAGSVAVRWEHVEGLEVWEYHVRGTTQRFLGVRTTAAAPANPGPLGSAVSDLVLGDRPRVNVSLNLLAVSTDELVSLVRRFWDGPVGGSWESAPVGRSPLRCSLGWLGRWALIFALGIALVVVFVLVAEAIR